MKEILVNMTLTKDVNIPVNSVAIIKPSLLQTISIEIKLGDATTYIPKNGTIATEATAGIFNDVLSKIDPVLYQVTKAVSSIDSVLMSVNRILDPSSKNNIHATLENLNKTTANLIGVSASLSVLLNTQTGALAGTLNNLNSFTSNLDKNNGKINNLVGNLDKTATNLSQLDLQKTKIKIIKWLLVNFNRNVSLLCSACKLGVLFYNRMVKLFLFDVRGIYRIGQGHC
jgi:phospholipid/cholesterol/gamma-HCH transport system substrate-binding protein